MSNFPVTRIGLRSFSKMSELDKVDEVDIDEDGVFKYILIEVREKGKDNPVKKIVRGHARCEYHGLDSLKILTSIGVVDFDIIVVVDVVGFVFEIIGLLIVRFIGVNDVVVLDDGMIDELRVVEARLLPVGGSSMTAEHRELVLWQI
ncbi:hypothetical protein QAD02_016527 [Eretmocerus hayati]|uniref:Uncharacterized protein n=1 Tax=Eretmocerus hayati TaxID=131215 RepID=A0ACC2PAW6_9HYME|nr:hypothetical protein QAD02_016527 [Eretmocerus hayati]